MGRGSGERQPRFLGKSRTLCGLTQEKVSRNVTKGEEKGVDKTFVHGFMYGVPSSTIGRGTKDDLTLLTFNLKVYLVTGSTPSGVRTDSK